MGLLGSLTLPSCIEVSGPRPGWPSNAFKQGGAEEVSWRDTQRPWVIGHRGTGEEDEDEPWPENTIPAMLHAIEVEGAVGVEIDVMLTRDKQVVVMHDPRLERTTLCMGCVSERTLAEVQQCVAKQKLGDIRPPSLKEALIAMRDLPVEPLIMLDTKLAPMDGCPLPAATSDEHAVLLGRRVGEALRDSGVAHTAAVQGRVAPLLLAVRELAPQTVTIIADTDLDVGVKTAQTNRFGGVVVGLEKLEESGVSRARASGQLIDTFVVNAPVDLATAVYYGVDVIETDHVTEIYDAFDVGD
jgi:glycerophosphoryl diester phosphodiesterase